MKSNAEWIKWGAHDPLFAVASWQGKERDGDNPWTDAEFYALGKSDFGDFISMWNSFGCEKGHCVEIGCGAGRITSCLAEAFAQVTALDVSQEQLDYARAHIDRPNIHFCKVNGVDMPVETGSATAVFSVHVFQHFDSEEDAGRVFAEIFRVLKPGGTLMIHLPLYSLPHYPVAPFLARIISLSKKVGSWRAAMKRRAGQLLMRGLSYDRDQLSTNLQRLGFSQIEYRTLRVTSNQSWHDFLLARK